MASSKIISKEELPIYLNRIFKNLNLSNKDFIDYIQTFYIDGKNETYYYNIFKCIFIEKFKEQYKTSHTSFYKFYWELRGWSSTQAEDLVRQAFKKDIVFFNSSEISQYIINNKLWDFNIKNVQFINDFVSTIKIDDHISLNDIQKIYLTDWIHKFFNGPIKGFPKTQVSFYLSRGYSKEEAIKMISQLQKECSVRSIEYYKKRGYSEEDAVKAVSEAQSSFAEKSKATALYWVNLGLSEQEAQEKAYYYANLRSVWGRTYWMNQGLTEEEALEKTHEFNNSCIECKCYDGDIGLYVNTIKRFSEKQKEVWKVLSKNSAKMKSIIPKIGFVSHISKSEKKCFDYLIANIDPEIKHVPYIVIFPEGFKSQKNNYFYACDGYLMINEDKVIIIEYDGGLGVFHKDEDDEIRDKEILTIDDNVVGILRLGESIFKKKNLVGLKEKIENALKEIKSGQKEILILK